MLSRPNSVPMLSASNSPSERCIERTKKPDKDTAKGAHASWPCVEKLVFCLTGPYLTRRATIGRLELPLGRGRFVWNPPMKPPAQVLTAFTARAPGFINYDDDC